MIDGERRTAAAAVVGLDGDSAGLLDDDELEQLLASVQPDAPPMAVLPPWDPLPPADPEESAQADGFPPAAAAPSRRAMPSAAMFSTSVSPLPSFDASSIEMSLAGEASAALFRNGYQVCCHCALLQLAPLHLALLLCTLLHPPLLCLFYATSCSCGPCCTTPFCTAPLCTVPCCTAPCCNMANSVLCVNLSHLDDLIKALTELPAQYAKVVRARLLHYSVCSLVGQCLQCVVLRGTGFWCG